MVRPMENTTEMQAMVNGAGDATDNNESQVKGQLISKEIFKFVNSSKNERKHLHKINIERLVLCPLQFLQKTCYGPNFLSKTK